MPAKDDFPAVFEKLRDILKKHEKHCEVKKDTGTDYYLDSKKPDAKGKPQFFGSVSIKKSQVSFYLMPVYCYPELLTDISPELKAHMQGKSCFNFKTVDAALFKELAALVKKSADDSKKHDYL